MWICINNAFLSIVRKDGKPNELCVRARRKSHINNVFPGAKVVKTENNDYKYRTYIDDKEVAQVIAKQIADITYDNFKDTVEEHDLHRAYLNFWLIMSQYQDKEDTAHAYRK